MMVFGARLYVLTHAPCPPAYNTTTSTPPQARPRARARRLVAVRHERPSAGQAQANLPALLSSRGRLACRDCERRKRLEENEPHGGQRGKGRKAKNHGRTQRRSLRRGRVAVPLLPAASDAATAAAALHPCRFTLDRSCAALSGSRTATETASSPLWSLSEPSAALLSARWRLSRQVVHVRCRPR